MPDLFIDGTWRSALDERTRQRLVGGDVQVREEHEPFAEPGVLLRNRLFHLEQELRLGPYLVDGHDLRAGARILAVRERAAFARGRLDEHVVPPPHELVRACRRQRDAVLVGLDLLGDPDAQDARDSSGCGGA